MLVRVGCFLGRPPFLPFVREAAAFFSDLVEPSATAAGFFPVSKSFMFIWKTRFPIITILLHRERSAH